MGRRVVVIGGGIAGLSAACQLAPHCSQLTLVEREPLLFSHSSGRNAAIYRPLEESAAVTELASRASRLFDELSPGRPLVDACGLMLVAGNQESLTTMTRRADEFGLSHRLLDQAALMRARPELIGGRCRYGLELPSGGILDTHALGEALRKRALQLGSTIRFGVHVREITHNGQRVTGIRCDRGEHTPATDVVLAAGAWGSQLGSTCGSQVKLTPHRRHLAQLIPTAGAITPKAINWDVELGAYFRREGHGVLATPGDHTPYPASLPPVDPTQVEQLAGRLPELSPGLKDSQVQRVWACLRTMSHDQEMVVGPSGECEGLWWFGGLAGHGMSAALSAAELLAASFTYSDSTHQSLNQSLHRALGPQRFERRGPEVAEFEAVAEVAAPADGPLTRAG